MNAATGEFSKEEMAEYVRETQKRAAAVIVDHLLGIKYNQGARDLMDMGILRLDPRPEGDSCP